MAILCPLCLQKVGPGDRFFVYCKEHKGNTPVDSAAFLDDFERVRCPQGEKCNVATDIWSGVFVAHARCRFLNPLTGAGTSIDLELPTGINVTVDTAETRLLIEAAKVYTNQPAMWYPLALLRAINDKSRAGRLVLLAGPLHVGKSIIATMAMNPRVYAGTATEALKDYFAHTYVSAGSLTADDPGTRAAFLSAANAVAKLKSGQRGAASVPATGPHQALVRAVFFTGSPPPRKSTVLRQAAGVARSVRNVFKQIWDTARGKSQLIPVSTPPTVALVDWGGERFWTTGDEQVAKVTANVDRVAVIIDASHLVQFGRDAGGLDTKEEPDSIAHACQRLNNAVSEDDMCVIVTKLDMFQSQLAGSTTATYLADLAKNEEAALNGRAREILIGWLEHGRDAGADYEKKLLDYLKPRPNTPVFFISTTNLGDKTLGTDKGMPRSTGLVRFMLWVLDRLPKDPPAP